MNKVISIAFFVTVLSTSLKASPIETEILPLYERYENKPPKYNDLGSRQADSLPDAQLTKTLEGMALMELIEYTAKNQNLRGFISDMMTSKYNIHKYLISIRKPGVYRSKGMYLITEDHYYIVNMDLAMIFIEIFGELITKLRFDPFYGEDERNEQLLELINRHCSKLIEVELPMNWSNLLVRPFENVVILTISNNLREKLDLNRMFPSMEELRLYNVEAPDSLYIVQHYPKLKRFFSFFYYGADPFALAIFEANPQITSLDVQNDESFEFLQRVSKLPNNIETLYFYPRQEYFERKGHPMDFNNVKNFIIETVEDFILPELPFSFDQLVNLTLDNYYPMKNDELRLPEDWYNAFRQLKVISMPKTRLTSTLLFDYEDRFILDHLSFKLSTEGFDRELIQFLGDTRAKSITITYVPNDISSEALVQILPGRWNYKLVPEVRRTKTNSLLLKRN